MNLNKIIAGLLLLGSVAIAVQSIRVGDISGERPLDDWAAQNPELEPVTLVPGSVYDGDTIRVRDRTGEELRIRFACIDAPEKDQDLGIEARDNLRNFLEGNDIYIRRTSSDRYGRIVAEVWVDHPQFDLILSQLIQTENGEVLPYDQYKNDCPSWPEIEAAGDRAKASNLGVWGNPELVPPWEHRQSR